MFTTENGSIYFHIWRNDCLKVAQNRNWWEGRRGFYVSDFCCFYGWENTNGLFYRVEKLTSIHDEMFMIKIGWFLNVCSFAGDKRDIFSVGFFWVTENVSAREFYAVFSVDGCVINLISVVFHLFVAFSLKPGTNLIFLEIAIRKGVFKCCWAI